jgi:Zn ribbon nucleic-acid-binding protein
MGKQCPNCQATMAADITSRPGFASYECTKCAFVVIEVVKETLPPKRGAR